MSRAFSHAAGDFVAFSPGNAGALDGGPQTTLMLWKADTTTAHGLISAFNASVARVWGINPYSDGLIYWTSSGFESTVSYAAGTWYLFATTKANGSAVLRGHVYNYDTATWAHTDFTSIGDATNGPITELRAGWYSAADVLNGKLAAMALWGSVLTDLQLEGLAAGLASWMALSPAWAVAFNQASTGTAVTDLTGGGGDQSSISGTSVSADEPAGWSYSLVTQVAVGQAVETDTAQSVTPSHRFTVGQATETDTATALTIAHVLTVGQATETDTANTITPPLAGGRLATSLGGARTTAALAGGMQAASIGGNRLASSTT